MQLLQHPAWTARRSCWQPWLPAGPAWEATNPSHFLSTSWRRKAGIWARGSSRIESRWALHRDRERSLKHYRTHLPHTVKQRRRMKTAISHFWSLGQGNQAAVWQPRAGLHSNISYSRIPLQVALTVRSGLLNPGSVKWLSKCKRFIAAPGLVRVPCAEIPNY